MTRTITFLVLGISTIACRAEWKPLFNGKDLAGWSGDPRLWRVENGVLVGETNDTDKKAAANTFLIWQGGEPGDFTLEYKARSTGNNNSGVQYRSKVLDAAKWSVGGYHRWTFTRKPNTSACSMRSAAAASPASAGRR